MFQLQKKKTTILKLAALLLQIKKSQTSCQKNPSKLDKKRIKPRPSDQLSIIMTSIPKRI